MPDITLNIPMMDAEQSVEIEVTINGKKRKYNYRVEIFQWEEDCEPSEVKVECLKRKISEYDPSWQLLHIGAPADRNIPVMFRYRGPAKEAEVSRNGTNGDASPGNSLQGLPV